MGELHRSILSWHLTSCDVKARRRDVSVRCNDVTPWRLDILWQVLGKNTDKEGTSREGTSTLRRCHDFWSSHRQTARQTVRQTESDAYEPTVHTHRWAQKLTRSKFYLNSTLKVWSNKRRYVFSFSRQQTRYRNAHQNYKESYTTIVKHLSLHSSMSKCNQSEKCDVMMGKPKIFLWICQI